MTETELGVDPRDPWAAYVRTVVTIQLPGTGAVTMCAAPAGDTGTWPWDSEQPVYVLTAWDPGDERLDDQRNRDRQAALERELAPQVARSWPTSGIDPTTGYRDEGMAVRGVAEDAVVAAAARFDQDAIFVWTTRTWEVRSCRDDRRLPLGWRCRTEPAEEAVVALLRPT